jgi:hypothetical protein
MWTWQNVPSANIYSSGFFLKEIRFLFCNTACDITIRLKIGLRDGIIEMSETIYTGNVMLTKWVAWCDRHLYVDAEYCLFGVFLTPNFTLCWLYLGGRSTYPILLYYSTDIKNVANIFTKDLLLIQLDSRLSSETIRLNDQNQLPRWNTTSVEE